MTGQLLAICYGVKPICPTGLSLVLKRNLKPLPLTDLKVHKPESLCIQILPQYKLDNQNCWAEFGTFDFSILSDLTSFLKLNGRWSKVPYIQAFWGLRSRPSLCKGCATYQILLCSLSPSTTKESKSKAPKKPPKPSVPGFNPADGPPPYHPRDGASRDETTPSSPSSSRSGSDDPKTPKEISTPPCINQGPKQTHVSSQRGSVTLTGLHLSPHPHTNSYQTFTTDPFSLLA